MTKHANVEKFSRQFHVFCLNANQVSDQIRSCFHATCSCVEAINSSSITGCVFLTHPDISKELNKTECKADTTAKG